MKARMFFASLAVAICCSPAWSQGLLNRLMCRSGCDSCQTESSCCESPCDDCCGIRRCRLFDVDAGCCGCGPRLRGLFPLFGSDCGCETDCCQAAPADNCGCADACCDRGSLFGGCGLRGRFGNRGCGGDCGCESECNDCCDPCGRGLLRGWFNRRGCGDDCGCETDACNSCDPCDPCARRWGITQRHICLTVPNFGVFDRLRGLGRRDCCDPCNTGCGCNGEATEGAQPAAEPAAEPQAEPAAEGSQTRIRSVPIIDPNAFRAPATRYTSGSNR